MTLNLQVESEFLRTFEFTITGFNINFCVEKLFEEFLASRDLGTTKILIDGSPFAYQNEMAEILATFYSLHRVQSECFLENSCKRLVRPPFDHLNARHCLKFFRKEN